MHDRRDRPYEKGVSRSSEGGGGGTPETQTQNDPSGSGVLNISVRDRGVRDK